MPGNTLGCERLLRPQRRFYIGRARRRCRPELPLATAGRGRGSGAGAGGSACAVGGALRARGHVAGAAAVGHGEREGPGGGGCVRGGFTSLPVPVFPFFSDRAHPGVIPAGGPGACENGPGVPGTSPPRAVPVVLRLSPGKRGVCNLCICSCPLDPGFALGILYVFSFFRSVCVCERERM